MWTAYINLSSAYNNSTQYLTSKVILEKARKLSPLVDDFAMFWNNLGVAYRGIGEDGEAIKKYTKAIKLDRQLVEAYVNLLELYLKGNKKAGEQLKKAEDKLGLDSSSINVYWGLGEEYFRTRQWDEAKGEYQKVIAIDPTNGEARDRLVALETLRQEMMRLSNQP